MRIGFIGTGEFAKKHAESLKRLGAEIVACQGTNAQKTAEFAHRFNARVYEKAEEILSNDVVDVLYLVVPPFALNGRLERLAVERQIPFLCEKPVALNMSFCKDIASAVEKQGLVTSSGYVFRSSEAPGKIDRIINTNRIIHVQCARIEGLHGPEWRRRIEKCGGTMMDCGTHTVDLLRRILGEVKSVSATTQAGICSSKYPDCDVYDLMRSQMIFENGTIADFTIGCFLNQGMPGKFTFDLYGENLVISLSMDSIRYKEGLSDWMESPVKLVDIDRHNGNFLEGVRTRNPQKVTGSYPDAVKTLSVTWAMDQSAKNGGINIQIEKER